MPTKKKSAATRRKNTNEPKRNPALRPSLDADASKHARLLNDPCYAPLCHPIYDGADGGILFRAEVDYLLYVTATSTCYTMVWSPGAVGVNAAGTTASNLVMTYADDSFTAVPAYNGNVYQSPGATFLKANSAAATCVAACLEVFWNGTENNRAGIISYGNVPARTSIPGALVSADALSQPCTYAERVPNTKITLKWRPSAGDQITTDPSADTPGTELAKRNAIAYAARGIPIGQTLRVRLVAVYQYEPRIGTGVVHNHARAMSNNTFEQVMNYLDKIGDWTSMAAGIAIRAGAIVAPPVMGAISYGNVRRFAY